MESEIEITKRLMGMRAWIHTLVGEAYPKHLQDVDVDSLKKVGRAVTGDMIQKIDEISRTLGKAAKSSILIRKQCGLGSFEKEEVETAESSHEGIVVPGIPEVLLEEREHFRVLMDVSNFSQEEVSVDVLQNHLVIHCKHEELCDEHGTISREFTRKFEIPPEVDVETIRALIDGYGVLTVKASLRKPVNGECKEVEIHSDVDRKTKLWAFENIGSGFRESAKRQIQDGMDMSDFVEKLAKQLPSTYIPHEEVV